MIVTQVAVGKFHHFHLARHLESYETLSAIYCGYPWFKLRGERLPRRFVRTFPWLQAPYMSGVLSRLFKLAPSVQREWEWWAKESLDWYASRTVPRCDVLVGLSGCALRTARVVKQRGAKFVCDRGSSHICYQDRLLREEYSVWGVRWHGVDPRVIDKELSEYDESDLITVPSEFVIQSFLAEGVPPGKLAKVPYGADIRRFKPQGEPPVGSFIVLFVGQLSIRKGLPYLLQAFAKFPHPRKELWLVGSLGVGAEGLLRAFGSAGVKLLGVVANKDLAALYSRAHVFVLPSIEEGLAMVQGEALACGCPVISSVNSGAADLFKDGVEGYIVPIRDTQAIVNRLTELADRPELRAEMSKAAKERVHTIGGWGAYGDAYLEVLRGLTAMRSDKWVS